MLRIHHALDRAQQRSAQRDKLSLKIKQRYFHSLEQSLSESYLAATLLNGLLRCLEQANDA